MGAEEGERGEGEVGQKERGEENEPGAAKVPKRGCGSGEGDMEGESREIE